MLAIIAFTSERVIEAAWSLPQRGSARRRTRASACGHDLLTLLGALLDVALGEFGERHRRLRRRSAAAAANGVSTAASSDRRGERLVSAR